MGWSALCPISVLVDVQAPRGFRAAGGRPIRRLFEAGHGIGEIAAAAAVRYEVVLAILRPS